MRPNRNEPASALFWFQSLKFGRMAASYTKNAQIRRMMEVFDL